MGVEGRGVTEMLTVVQEHAHYGHFHTYSEKHKILGLSDRRGRMHEHKNLHKNKYFSAGLGNSLATDHQ